MPDLTKDFFLSWARQSLRLSSALASAKNELSNEGAALQQLQEIERTELATPAKVRELALRLALAEYHVNYHEL